MSIADARREYERAGLNDADLASDPIVQLRRLAGTGACRSASDPTAMVLSTATLSGRPSARIVLLKGLDEHGLTFFTNYHSRKGRELAANPWAALTFFWPQIERQVRVEGQVALIPAQASDEYFRSRPRDSQSRCLGLGSERDRRGGVR